MEFKNSAAETDTREITFIDAESNLIYWKDGLTKNYNEGESTITLANDPPVVAWEY